MSRRYVYVDLDEGKKAIVAGEDGLPMFEEESGVGEDGATLYTQKTADAFHLIDKVHAMGKDLDNYKSKLRNAKAVVTPLFEKGIIKEDEFFSGVKDPFEKWLADADSSIEKAKNFDSIKTKDIDEIKRQLGESTREKIESIQKDFSSKEEKYQMELMEAEDQIRKLMINDKFSSSDFIKKNCADIPIDIIINSFSNKFKVEKDEDGRRITVGYKTDGKPIYSEIKTGDLADFDEAVGKMIKEDKNSGFYLKGIVGAGTGGGGGRSTQNSVKAEIAKLQKEGRYAEASALMRQLKEKV